MATVPRVLCDVCRTEKDVALITVRYEGRPPWEADLCKSCYEQTLGVLSRKGRRASKSNVRPQHKFEKTADTAITL